MIKTITLGLGLLAASSANAKLAYFVELGTGFSKPEAGAGLSSDLVVTGAHKFSDDVKAGFEVIQGINYLTAGDSNFSLTHKTLRFPVTFSNLKWLGDSWKTSFTVRWTAPTSAGAHKIGGLGAVLLRPAFSTESGDFSFLARPSVSLPLTDSYKQKYVVPGEAADSINLFSYAVELFPSYNINDKMGLGASVVMSQAYKAAIAGTDAAFQTALFSWDLELGLPVKAGPASFAVSVGEGDLPLSDLKMFKAETLSYNFYVRAEF